jgi:flagellar protein FliS
MNRKALQSYQTTQITTASPGKILLMLYEGAIKFVRIARVRLEEGNLSEKGKYISKTIDILSEFINTLDHETGGQLAADLENLYLFMIDKLIEANAKNSSEAILVVDKILCTLYEGWKDVINHPRADGIPSPELQPELHQTFENHQKK